MTMGNLFRVFAWAAVVGVLLDLLRRCWIVEAGAIFSIAAVLLVFALIRLRCAWRTARRQRLPADFLRIR